MTEQQFCDKWIGDLDGFWATDSSTIFWARSYKMPIQQLVEMSLDFMKANNYVGGCSSYRLAENTVYRYGHLFPSNKI